MTKTMNERFSRLLIECKQEMNTLNIPYNYESNMILQGNFSRAMGQTRMKRRGTEKTFEISLANDMEYANNKGIKDTILHELIHTIEGCFNHGEKFHHYANMLNRKYGYDIDRTGSMESICSKEKFEELKEQRENTSKYKITCKGCGHVYLQSRRSKFIDRQGIGYICTVCNSRSNFEVVQNY